MAFRFSTHKPPNNPKDTSRVYLPDEIEILFENGELRPVIHEYTKKKSPHGNRYLPLSDLQKADPRRVFITHSGIDKQIEEEVYQFLKGLNYFNEILITRAGGVISSHCGPNTLGILFYEK